MSKHFNSNSLIEEENYPHTNKNRLFFSYKCLSAFDLIIFDLLFQIKQQRKKEQKICRQVRLIFLSLFFLFSLFLFSISSPVHSREKQTKNYFLIPVNWHQPGVVLRLRLVL
jgi:ATP/ADP translocase